MSYLNLVDNAKQNLRASEAEFIFDKSGSPLSAEERKLFAEDEQYQVPDDWFELFNSIDGTDVLWNLAIGDTMISGYFMFTSFIGLFERSTENKLWVDWYEEGDILEMKKHRILEMLQGDDKYITVKFEDDGSYQLYFVDGSLINHGGSKELPKLPLDLKQYIRVITDFFGAHSLRYHLHKEDFYNNPEKYLPEYDLLKSNIRNFNPPLQNQTTMDPSNSNQ